jgi:hypothetical protein
MPVRTGRFLRGLKQDDESSGSKAGYDNLAPTRTSSQKLAVVLGFIVAGLPKLFRQSIAAQEAPKIAMFHEEHCGSNRRANMAKAA